MGTENKNNGGSQMLIKDDKSYLHLWEDVKNAGFTVEKVSRIDFNYKNDDNIIKILDWLENNFKMYQYKKDNGLRYGDHELHYWSNGTNYIQLSFNTKNSFDSWDILLSRILNHITENYSDTEGEIYLHYQNCIDWEKINDYVMNTNFDINSLPLEKLQIICHQGGLSGSLLSKESKVKLAEIENNFLENLEGKKVVYNNMKGNIKKFRDDYVFFKQRATKTYYNIGLAKIRSLDLV